MRVPETPPFVVGRGSRLAMTWSGSFPLSGTRPRVHALIRRRGTGGGEVGMPHAPSRRPVGMSFNIVTEPIRLQRTLSPARDRGVGLFALRQIGLCLKGSVRRPRGPAVPHRRWDRAHQVLEPSTLSPTISARNLPCSAVMRPTVMGRRKRRGPALPGLKKSVPFFVSILGWCE